MILSTVFALSSLPALALAQAYGAPAPGPAQTTSSAAASVPSAPADTTGHVNVDVGFNGGFTFHPANVSAPNGTTVTFWFPSPGFGHSVTQSSFAAPCTYLQASGSNPAGFDSGLQQGVQFSINITDDSKPIWFHCKQVSHCGMGMVGSINAPASGNNTFQAFQSAAMAIGSSETTETDNGPVTGGVGGVATAAPAATGTGTSSASGSSNGAIQLGAGLGLPVFIAALFAMLA